MALDAVSALETGHAQYLTSRSGECRAGLGRERPGHLGAGSTSLGCLLPSGGFPPQVPLQEAEQVPPPCPPGSPALQAWVIDLGLVPALLCSNCMTFPRYLLPSEPSSSVDWAQAPVLSLLGRGHGTCSQVLPGLAPWQQH